MEQITVIRKALGESPSDEVKDALKELESAFKGAQDVQSKFESLQAKVEELELSEKVAKQDMMKYKSIQQKATQRVSELQDELEEKENSLKSFDKERSELQDLRKRYAEQQAQELAKMREDYKSKLDGLAKHPAYDRIKDKIVLPTDENPLEKLSDEDLKKSLDKITEWEDLGLLEGKDSRTPTTGSGREVAGDEQDKSLRKAFGLPPKKKE